MMETVLNPLAALKMLLADIEEYQRINHLGGEQNQSQVVARAAIANAEKDVQRNPLQHELLDLITLMPDSQTQELIDYILELRRIRATRDTNT